MKPRNPVKYWLREYAPKYDARCLGLFILAVVLYMTAAIVKILSGE